ncbi:MAG: TIGR02266 family protein [Deltaproteobacteria bacterium]|nr:TIGR02266 family protein [Deltaproteobacteria bacterium]MCL5792054.1 TIGR02266 family protein [Deltaproteobacteria bacterium]
MAAEKRNNTRLDTKLEVKYGDITSFISDYAMNISRGGMFISTKNTLAIGTTIEIEFTIPAITVPIRVQGKVTWVNAPEKIKGTNLIPGMGVEFNKISSDDRKKLEHFIEKLSLMQSSQNV